MKKIILLALVFAMIISIVACGQKQTPPTAVDNITNSNSNSVTPPVNLPEQTPDEKQSALLSGMAPAAFSPYDAPAHVTEDYPFQSLTVSFNTDVIVPEVMAYSVVKMQKRALTHDELFAIVNLLADTTSGVYGKWEASKDQWKGWLDEAEQHKDEKWIDRGYIDFLRNCYNAAEEKVSHEPIDSASIVQGAAEQTFYVPSQDGITAHKFQVFADGFIYSANAVSAGNTSLQTDVILKRNIGEFRSNDETREQYLWRSPGEPSLSQEEAYEQAAKLLRNMGFSDLALCYAEPCSLIDRQVNKTTGWAFTFTRDVTGLNTQDEMLLGSSFISNDATPAYFAPWDRERVIIAMAKDGVRSVTVRGISRIVDTEFESVQLLTFDVMQECIAENLNKMYAQMYADNPYMKGIIEVTSVSLSTSMIADNGQTDEGYYVPSWIVNYTIKMNESEDLVGQIIFNAADGSYIEPRMTAQDLGR